MSNTKTILEWTYVLQHKLDQMDSDQLNEFMKGKAIRYNGQLYSMGVESETKTDGIDSKRTTKRTPKKSSGKSENLRAN